MDWYLKVLKQYADFEGRARRKEYWMFTLFHIIFTIGSIIVDISLGLDSIGIGIAYLLYTLATFLPSLAVTVRRLHDTDKSGFLVLVGFIPFVGWLILLVFTLLEGQNGGNKYGPDPKTVDTLN